MKTFTIAFAVIAIMLPNIINTQVPNGSFEDWDVINGVKKPVSWDFNQSLSLGFIKDTISVEGDFSLKLFPTNSYPPCSSVLNTSIQLDSILGENKSLSFYAKSELTPPNYEEEWVFFQVKVSFFEDGIFLDKIQWQTLEEIDTFTKFTVSLAYPEADQLSIEILGGAIEEVIGGCVGRSTSWIDDLKIEESPIVSSNEIFKQEKDDYLLYPNPTTGKLYIKDEKNIYNKFRILDLMGKLIHEGEIINAQLEIPRTFIGTLFVELISAKNQFRTTRKVLVSR